jgi:hypothetical protein
MGAWRTIKQEATLVAALAVGLSACGGGGGGSTNQPTTNPPPASSAGITPTLTATTVPDLMAQLHAQFPIYISSDDVTELSDYTLAQTDALGTTNANSLFEGEWLFYVNGSGVCYVLNGATYDQNCGVLLPSQGQSITQPVGDLIFSGTTSTKNGGSFGAKDLTNGQTEKGNFKLVYGFQARQTTGSITTLPFAILVVGDVESGGVYSYSDFQEFVGTVTITADGKLTCSLSSAQATKIPGVFGRYKLSILKGALTPGLSLDYDFILAPATEGSVPAAPLSCTTSMPITYVETSVAGGFGLPQGMALDSAGSIYVADSKNNRISRISPAGVVTIFAGSGLSGSSDGTAIAASFNGPSNVAVDQVGNVFVTDSGNNKIRKISPAGLVTTIASMPLLHDVATDGAGNLYVASGNIIAKIDALGAVSVLAGDQNTPGHSDGTGTNATFTSPLGLAVDKAGTVYVADGLEIRQISFTGVVTTLAGSSAPGEFDGTGAGAGFIGLYHIALDGTGNIYAIDSSSNVRAITKSGVVTTVWALSGGTVQTPGPPALTGGIAVNGSGEVFVGDVGGGISKLSPK